MLQTLISLLLPIHNPLDLDKCSLNQMIKYLALHFNIPHYSSRLEVFEQDNALEPYLVLIIALLTVIHAFIPSYQVVEYQAKIVTQVLILFVNDDLMIAGELYLVVFDQFRKVSY